MPLQATFSHDRSSCVEPLFHGEQSLTVHNLRAPRTRPPLLGGIREQFQRCRINAITQPGRCRPVIEDMAQMRRATRAAYLHPHHAVTAIRQLTNRITGDRLPVTGPATTGIKFRLGTKQWCLATDTAIQASCLGCPILPRERRLGAALPAYPELLGGQFAAPLIFTLLHRPAGLIVHQHRSCRP